MNNSKISESIKLLRLFRENGVDEIIANTSYNRLKNTEKLRKKDLMLENDTVNSNSNMETDQINKISTLEQLKSQKCRPLFVGLGYDYQILEERFGESHDIKYDLVITESRVLSYD